jgi:XTP/dITP diphosphohydrolase
MIRKPPVEILIATGNPGKIREIEQALSGLPVKFRYLAEFSNVSSVEEVGQTYEENATLKALGYLRETGICALADDSGLEVDSLGGIPGVFSARFGGAQSSDLERTEKLLATLSEYPVEQRTARFVCCMVLAGWQAEANQTLTADPHRLTVMERRCEGTIATAPRGSGGFGYDPVFVPVGYDMTFAELPPAVKNKISHRALALAAMREFLDRWLGET